VTPETGLTIAQADMQLSKDGGAFAQKNAAGNATHDVDGWYSTTLDATDTATTGDFKIQVNVAGSLPVWVTYFVLTQSAYDALQTGTFNNLGGTAQTADHTTAIADIPTVSEFNARTLLAAGYFDPAADTVANVTLVATTTTNTDMRGTDSANTVVPPSVAQFNARTILSADYFDPATDAVANVTLVATTTTNTDMVSAAPTTAQIWAETTRLLTAGTNIVLAKGVGVTGFNDLSSAQVNAEMLDVLATDTFAEVTVPSATASIKDMIHYTFSRVRNKTTQTATTLTVRNDADSGNLGTATVSDDGTTFTKGEDS
jgi:hypothetical protein